MCECSREGVSSKSIILWSQGANRLDIISAYSKIGRLLSLMDKRLEAIQGLGDESKFTQLADLPSSSPYIRSFKSDLNTIRNVISR